MFKDRIRIARESKHLTQEELGQRLDSTGATVRNWEHGRTSPSDKRIAEIAQVLGKSIEWLKGDAPIESEAVGLPTMGDIPMELDVALANLDRALADATRARLDILQILGRLK